MRKTAKTIKTFRTTTLASMASNTRTRKKRGKMFKHLGNNALELSSVEFRSQEALYCNTYRARLASLMTVVTASIVYVKHRKKKQN